MGLQIVLIHNTINGKPRGYAFIEYEHERDMHCKLLFIFYLFSFQRHILNFLLKSKFPIRKTKLVLLFVLSKHLPKQNVLRPGISLSEPGHILEPNRFAIGDFCHENRGRSNVP